ncbi:MAG: oxidoreductase [Bacteroidetes bacterium]|nr:MAG: oxidoreductase [Bacteroidota bacterium]
MKKLLTSVFLFFALMAAYANPPTIIKKNLEWTAEPRLHVVEGSPAFEIWHFDGAVYNDAFPSLPVFSDRFRLNDYAMPKVVLTDAVFEPFDKQPSKDDAFLSDQVQFFTEIEQDRNAYYGVVSFIPIIKTGPNRFERLVSFTLRLEYQSLPTPAHQRGGHTTVSVLSDGDIYKFGVTKDGVYKLDYDFLANELGIPLNDIDPRNIQIFGNGGGRLPEPVDAERQDDLHENAIFIEGESDGKFDNGDYILFYAEGPDGRTFDADAGVFRIDKNVYDEKNYYFLKIGSQTGRRLNAQNSVAGTPDYTARSFNEILHFEEDKVNLLHDWNQGQGSGQRWFGDLFKVLAEKDYSDVFSVSNIVPDAPATIEAVMAGRIETGTGAGGFKIIANGNNFTSPDFNTTPAGPTDSFASIKTARGTFLPGTDEFNILLQFTRGNGVNNEGWLDYIELNFRRKLIWEGEQLIFRDVSSMAYNLTQFVLSNATSNVEVWDITNPLEPKVRQTDLVGDEMRFQAMTKDQLLEFVAFDRKNGPFLQPEKAGDIAKIDNQNIHGITDADFVIVYPEVFQPEAVKLANHRAEHSDMVVELVEINQLFNEFSSGRKDPTAIRDFAKMLFERSDNFRYLLLFGDGSYDFRNINNAGNDFIPVYETHESTHPITAFPSDDYFALLSPGEGGDLTEGALDIAVGRLPVKTLDEASQMVTKIIRYETDDASLGDWRNRIVFVGDDEDSGRHTKDADGIAETIGAKNKNLNVDKIYVDAYKQEASPFGVRVPLATEALNKDIFKGALAVTYLGHGGSKGWTQERILKISDILSWKNGVKLPIFITATCSFSGYDNPNFTTGGEHVLLNPNGGSIALFTTVRAVYASANEELTREAVDTLFFKLNDKRPTIGEVLRLAKNKVGRESNSRKFTLLGDPSMELALPNYRVATTSINGKAVSAVSSDTLRALQKVTIAGEIQDDSGNLILDFNGKVFPTIFDKKVTYQTLGQDPGSPVISYKLQKNIIFKGQASVKNGKFEFTFVVPKDINYEYGAGKISYYAADWTMYEDAAGHYEGVIIGGTDANALTDDIGPKVDVYMNSEDFIFGGTTGSSPVLLVKLEDDNGINVVGNSIGHDLTGILDQETRNTYVLNDFYESELDNYTKGEVRFPLSDLSAGLHSVKITAWDIANNVSEGYTEFVVVTSEKMALEHVLNYPNPFTSSTCFMFEHGRAGQDLDVMVQIYTVSGRLVKTLQKRIFSSGDRLNRDNCLPWDGTDDFGDPLAKGVYLYKVKVQNQLGDSVQSGESDFEKLVILK